MVESGLLRITIMMDFDLQQKLRTLQANVIKRTDKSCSFSRIVNIAAGIGMKQITIDKVIKEIERE